MCIATVAGRGLANVDRWLSPAAGSTSPELCATVLIVCVVARRTAADYCGAVASVAICGREPFRARREYAATALNVRSSVERDHFQAARFGRYGDRIGIFAVQGFCSSGTAWL